MSKDENSSIEILKILHEGMCENKEILRDRIERCNEQVRDERDFYRLWCGQFAAYLDQLDGVMPNPIISSMLGEYREIKGMKDIL